MFPILDGDQRTLTGRVLCRVTLNNLHQPKCLSREMKEPRAQIETGEIADRRGARRHLDISEQGCGVQNGATLGRLVAAGG